MSTNPPPDVAGVRPPRVLPGRAPDTHFGQNARARAPAGIPEAYADLAARVFAGWQAEAAELTRPIDVAEAIWRAATDPSCTLRQPAGADALALASSR